MRKDIIVSGVGGQGILSISASIAYAALDLGLYINQSEVHGMSQRGGEVQSHIRLSDKEIHSVLIPKGKADMLMSMEPMESLRYLPFLHSDGWLITGKKPVINIPNYPDPEKIYDEICKVKNHIIIPAEEIAKNINSLKSANIVILGSATPFLNIQISFLEKAIERLFESKGQETINFNITALRAGADYTRKYVN